jgi:hypothetical protein
MHMHSATLPNACVSALRCAARQATCEAARHMSICCVSIRHGERPDAWPAARAGSRTSVLYTSALVAHGKLCYDELPPSI